MRTKLFRRSCVFFLVVVLSVEVESLEVSVLLEVSALESEFLTEE